MSVDPKLFLNTLFDAAVNQALPKGQIESFLSEELFFNSSNFQGRTVVVGAGKAAASMAQELERVWEKKLAQDLALGELEGVVVTRYGHTASCSKIEVIEASHPVPDEEGVKVGRRILDLVGELTKEDTLICLLSGGGSALLNAPPSSISLQEKQAINKALLKSGAAIDEMNCVRKHLSLVKGGRLAKAAYPANVISLAISDVPGDDFSVIASGPTVPDPTTRHDALAILDRYQIDAPTSVLEWLNSEKSETIKTDDKCWSTCQSHLIATPQSAIEAAANKAQELGVTAHILSDCIEGEAREVAKMHAALAKQVSKHGQPFSKPCVILSGGETTVTVKGYGRGGRNCEFLLSLHNELRDFSNVFALAADTDGIDGVEDNAGALITPDMWDSAQQKQLIAEEYLENNDSYHYFQAEGALITTGPTLTNVNDFRAILVL